MDQSLPSTDAHSTSAAADDARAAHRASISTPPASTATPATPTRRWRSSELLGQAQEVEIEHGSSVYRLRLTGMGKLILTK